MTRNQYDIRRVHNTHLVICRGFETHAGYRYGYGSPFWDQLQAYTSEAGMAGSEVVEFETSHH